MQVKPLNVFATAVVASIVAAAASAQTNTFSGTGLGTSQTAAEAQNEQLGRDIEDDFDRNLDRFGNAGRQLGFDGSVSLRGTATNGNEDSYNLGIGANFGYYDGVNGYDLILSYAFARSRNDPTVSDPNGELETDEDRLLYNFQYTRDFTPVLYGFAKLQGSYRGDDNSGDALFDTNGNVIIDDSGDVVQTPSRENDIFLGLGIGYKVIDSPNQQWNLQAGPGYRFANFGDITSTVTDFDDDDVNEAALSVTSNFSQQVNDIVFFTMDTDIIYSSSDTVIYNDAGVNVAMSDALALRTSLQTEFHTDPIQGNNKTDNRLGLSLVYNLN